MSGTLKVGGVNLATHTGTDGTGNPVLDSGVVFPAGHVRFLAKSAVASVTSVTASVNLLSALATGTFTAGSRIWIEFHIGSVYQEAGSDYEASYGHGYLVGAAASTGTITDSGLCVADSGEFVIQEIGYKSKGSHTVPGYTASRLITPINGATSASYNFYYKEQVDGRSFWFYKMQMSLWEVF